MRILILAMAAVCALGSAFMVWCAPQAQAAWGMSAGQGYVMFMGLAAVGGLEAAVLACMGVSR